jgi:hypothetical protein
MSALIFRKAFNGTPVTAVEAGKRKPDRASAHQLN